MKNIKTAVYSVIAGLSLTSFAMAEEAEIGGYCPVCYVSAGKAVKGTDQFKSEHEGDTYYFVHADAKAAFDKEPAKFIPAYDGLCSYGVSLGKEFPADPTQFTVVDGVIYLNSSADIKKKFDAKPKEFIRTADAKWKKMMVEMKAKEMKEKEMKEKEMKEKEMKDKK